MAGKTPLANLKCLLGFHRWETGFDRYMRKRWAFLRDPVNVADPSWAEWQFGATECRRCNKLKGGQHG